MKKRSLFKRLLSVFIMGAVSSCTMACVQTGSTGSARQLPPTDPNQALLQLMQQQTFAQAIKNFDNTKDKCVPVKEFDLSCNELNFLFIKKCGVIDRPAPVKKVLPAEEVFYNQDEMG